MKILNSLSLALSLALVGCDSLNDAKKLAQEVEYYKNLAGRSRDALDQARGEIDKLKNDIANGRLEIDKLSGEIKNARLENDKLKNELDEYKKARERMLR